MREIDSDSVLGVISRQFEARPLWLETNTAENVSGLYLIEAAEYYEAVLLNKDKADIYSEVGDMVYFAQIHAHVTGELQPWMVTSLLAAEAHVQKLSEGKENLFTCGLRKAVRNDMKYPAAELQEGDYDEVMSSCRVRWEARGGDEWFNEFYDGLFNGDPKIGSIPDEWAEYSFRHDNDLETMFGIYRALVVNTETIPPVM